MPTGDVSRLYLINMWMFRPQRIFLRSSSCVVFSASWLSFGSHVINLQLRVGGGSAEGQHRNLQQRALGEEWWTVDPRWSEKSGCLKGRSIFVLLARREKRQERGDVAGEKKVKASWSYYVVWVLKIKDVSSYILVNRSERLFHDFVFSPS